MFGKSKPFSGFAVNDLAKAKEFYGDTLGMQVTEENDLLHVHLRGGGHVLIYPKPDHVPAGFTVLNFPVDDVEKAVDDLVAHGIEMERYEGFEADAKGIVHEGSVPFIAWFKDPSGNILSVVKNM